MREIKLRLRAKMMTSKTVNDFINDVASSSPAPGGGSVAALAGTLGIALTSMVCNLTIGKKKYLDVESEIKEVSETIGNPAGIAHKIN